MANTRTRMRDYKGFTITKVNGYKYHATDSKANFISHDLKTLKAKINEYLLIKKDQRDF